MSKLKDIIERPFPEDGGWKKSIFHKLIISVFVSLFLILIKPFGLLVNSNTLPHLIILGVLTFVISILVDVIAKYIFKIEYEGPKFTFKRWLSLSLLLIIIIAVSNYLYISWLTNHGLDQLIKIIGYTFLISLFPLFFIGTIQLAASEKKNKELAETVFLSNSPEFNSKNDQKIFQIPISEILFFEALQNYIQITYIDEFGNVKVKTERYTLKKVNSSLQNSSFIKCHRSFIVNISKIKHISGNSQGFMCTLKNCSQKIPVSRSFIPSFRTKMDSYSSQN